MGQRGEIYSTRLFLDDGQKTFFFNVKENRYHDYYLNIVESRKSGKGFKRSSLVCFDIDVDKFLEVLNKIMDDIRGNKNPSAQTLSVGGGRREYTLRLPPRGRSALQIIEKREDATGLHRESIIIPVDFFDLFSEGLLKAVSALKHA